MLLSSTLSPADIDEVEALLQQPNNVLVLVVPAFHLVVLQLVGVCRCQLGTHLQAAGGTSHLGLRPGGACTLESRPKVSPE